jgi:hypothetical protein
MSVPRLHLVAAALALPAIAKAAPDSAVAAGRVAFAVDDGRVRDSVDPTGAARPQQLARDVEACMAGAEPS